MQVITLRKQRKQKVNKKKTKSKQTNNCVFCPLNERGCQISGIQYTGVNIIDMLCHKTNVVKTKQIDFGHGFRFL